MKRVFQKGFREYEFFNPREIRFMDFSDRYEAMNFLRGFIHDHFQMTALRKLLERESLSRDLAGMSDYSVLEIIADVLATKRICVMERYDLFNAGVHKVGASIPDSSGDAIQSAPTEDAFEPEPEPQPEQAPPSAAMQAQALVAAAASGAPVCEA